MKLNTGYNYTNELFVGDEDFDFLLAKGHIRKEQGRFVYIKNKDQFKKEEKKKK